MPILDVSRNELGPRRARATPAYIEQVMLWPTDQGRRDRAAAAVAAVRIRDAIADYADPDSVASLTHAQLGEVMTFAITAARLSDIKEDGRKPFVHGVAAGLILCEILDRRASGSPRAQLGAAMDKVAATLTGVGGTPLSRKPSIIRFGRSFDALPIYGPPTFGVLLLGNTHFHVALTD